MKTRYTEKALAADIASLNAKLDRAGAEYRLSQGGSYGRTDVDLATPEQLSKHCCQRRLVSGSPRECLAACNAYVVGAL